MSRAQLGKAWPFSVSAGVIHCEGAGAVTFEANGTTYAVNGTARQQNAGVDIHPIWVADPAYPGLKKSIGPIIDRGLRLCD